MNKLNEIELEKVRKRLPFTEQWKKNMSDAHKGISTWQLGLTKETDIRVQHISDARKDMKFSEEHKQNISKSKRGVKISDEHKHNIGEGHRYMKFSEEHKHNIGETRKKRIRNGQIIMPILPKKDTKPEIKLQTLLKELYIEFLTHQYMHIEHGYQCDIIIPKQEGIERTTIIECFGDYWHKYPIGREIDSLRCQELREKGYRVLVFWEREIKLMQLEDLKWELEKHG